MPPSISDSLSSSDAIVREGSNVSLTCHVDGYPKPDIKWKRDDGLQININKTLTGTDITKMLLKLNLEMYSGSENFQNVIILVVGGRV